MHKNLAIFIYLFLFGQFSQTLSASSSSERLNPATADQHLQLHDVVWNGSLGLPPDSNDPMPETPEIRAKLTVCTGSLINGMDPVSQALRPLTRAKLANFMRLFANPHTAGAATKHLIGSAFASAAYDPALPHSVDVRRLILNHLLLPFANAQLESATRACINGSLGNGWCGTTPKEKLEPVLLDEARRLGHPVFATRLSSSSSSVVLTIADHDLSTSTKHILIPLQQMLSALVSYLPETAYPLSNCEALMAGPWAMHRFNHLHPAANYDSAIALLREMVVGSFFLRPSLSKPNTFAISYKSKSAPGVPAHGVQQTLCEVQYDGSVKLSGNRFKNIQAAVQAYSPPCHDLFTNPVSGYTHTAPAAEVTLLVTPSLEPLVHKLREFSNLEPSLDPKTTLKQQDSLRALTFITVNALKELGQKAQALNKLGLSPEELSNKHGEIRREIESLSDRAISEMEVHLARFDNYLQRCEENPGDYEVLKNLNRSLIENLDIIRENTALAFAAEASDTP